jgi:hypothetical protein
VAIGFLAVLVLAWYHGERGAERATGIEVLMLTGILAMGGRSGVFPIWARPTASSKVCNGSLHCL